MRGTRTTLVTLLRSRLSARPRAAVRRERGLLLATATACAADWGWPVLPGAAADRDGCRCARPDCPTPGAHPDDPSLLAATTDPRMVEWWWGRRPDAPVLVATGGRVSAVSLPAAAGVRVLEYFDALRIRTGPVIATPTRYVLLVAPYTLPELGELLVAQEWVPTSLRYHGDGGYAVLPPSRTGAGAVRWVREPAGDGAPWLPAVGELMGALVAASAAVPDGARLAY
ncbi:bifunctional DNA primase/polymerase [Streptacidiphilus cavernicola]|uniref:Bifunctional DNA primase/polymerase n=1 Tax=Streptacidiphilus cavernicola TaxID=3342716 RepID=A0ABV6VVW5_9ACTN